MMAQRFSFELVTHPPVLIQPAVTLRPGEPIEMRIKQRS
jgi:hypothetical protein